jgi:pimeloyl-ACP methyl ester carboxylesterase
MKWIPTVTKTASRISPTLTGKWMAHMWQSPGTKPLKDWEHDIEKQGRRVPINNQLSSIHWGEGERHIFLMHGWQGRATQFAAFVEPLLKTGCKLIGIDAPGHGKSAKAKANPFVFAETLVEAQKRFGAPEAVVGHSMGGGAGILGVSLGLQTRGAVTLGGPSDLAGILQLFAEWAKLTPAATRAFFKEMERSVGHHPSEINPKRLSHHLEGVKGLIVHAADDKEVPYNQALMLASNWQEAKLRPAPGLGHRLIMRDRKVIQDVVDFCHDVVTSSSSKKEATA